MKTRNILNKILLKELEVEIEELNSYLMRSKAENFALLHNDCRHIKTLRSIVEDLKILAKETNIIKTDIKIDLKDLIEIRNYFGQHDLTPFEHKAYSVLDSIIKERL